MPVAIKIKRFETAGDVPNTSELVDGEIAVNIADKKIYVRDGSSIVTISGADFSAVGEDIIPDGDGTFTRSMGMLVNKPKQGFGMRSWRYAAIVNDGTIENMFIEPGQNDFSDDDDPYTVSSPEHVLSKL